MLFSLGRALTTAARQARVASLREELVIDCSTSTITLTNRTDRAASIAIEAAVGRTGEQDDYWERSPRGERINLPIPEQGLELSTHRIRLAAGASETLAYSIPPGGPCGAAPESEITHCPHLALALRGDIGAPSYECSLLRRGGGPQDDRGDRQNILLFGVPRVDPRDLLPPEAPAGTQ